MNRQVVSCQNNFALIYEALSMLSCFAIPIWTAYSSNVKVEKVTPSPYDGASEHRSPDITDLVH